MFGLSLAALVASEDVPVAAAAPISAPSGPVITAPAVLPPVEAPVQVSPVPTNVSAPVSAPVVTGPTAPTDIGTPILLAILCLLFAGIIAVGAFVLCRARGGLGSSERSPLLGSDDNQGPKSSLTV
jgi:hypothetical protein